MAALDKKKAMMQKNFNKMDTNGDGSLDFEELKDLLMKGNPTFTTEQVRTLYDKCDANGDGRVGFDEFLAYIYKASKSGAGRHADLAANAAVGDDGTEVDWRSCQHTFKNFAGKDMDGREFMKFCKDNKLIGKGFAKVDVDTVFAKVCRGARRMDFNMFKDACRHVAKKRNITNREVQEIVGDSSGPILAGTKAEYNKFHDDKSMYTGTHTHNETHGCDPTESLGRHEKIAQEHQALLSAMEAEEDDWSECQRVFNAFAGESKDMDGMEFADMCKEINGLMRGGLTKEKVEVIFAKCCPNFAKGQKRFQFEHFKVAVREMTLAKDDAIHVTQATIARSKGPTLSNVTEAKYNRFADDTAAFPSSYVNNKD